MAQGKGDVNAPCKRCGGSRERVFVKRKDGKAGVWIIRCKDEKCRPGAAAPPKPDDTPKTTGRWIDHYV